MTEIGQGQRIEDCDRPPISPIYAAHPGDRPGSMKLRALAEDRVGCSDHSLY